jgi:hypothetical protein
MNFTYVEDSYWASWASELSNYVNKLWKWQLILDKQMSKNLYVRDPVTAVDKCHRYMKCTVNLNTLHIILL